MDLCHISTGCLYSRPPSDSKTTPAWGATAGFLAGFGWVTLSIATIALFERRPWKYTLINGGYMTVAFTVMGLILGGWR